jgi:hypothetical protein
MRARIFACCLLGLVAFASSSLLSRAQLAGEKKSGVIIIKGVITNLDDGKDRIKDDTYLQLVFVPPDGKVPMQVSAAKVIYPSSLPKISVPATGPFSFECRGLRPGTYLVAVQRYQSPNESWRPFLHRGQTIASIVIPKDSPSPVINMGNVTLPLPPGPWTGTSVK